MHEGTRIYLRELRVKKGVSQDRAAEAIGWSLRSFSEWETGGSDDIKSRFLIRLVSLLEASWEELTYLELNSALVEEAKELAEKRSSITSQVPNYDLELQQLVDQLWADKELRNAFLVFWSGWKARELTP